MLYYDRKGNGETIILIHGFLSTYHVYDKVISDLIKHYDVIAVDLPGHGQSPFTNEKTIYDYTDKIIHLLSSLNILQATWIGHSMGGYITMAAVEKYLPYVKRAVFAYSSPVADTVKGKHQRLQQIETMRTKGLKTFIQDQLPKYFAAQSNERDLEEAYKHAEHTTIEGAIAATYAMKDRPDQVNMVNQSKIPLLFIEGKNDLVEMPFLSTSSFITKVKTDTSHMGMLDNPSQFVSVLIDWLNQTKTEALQ
ncbi:alpha/beta fold hydrolase [Evansella halocellulosilytica]|uniref:alpha/beta fold hydrolase n=1 Tax=Evansella halocellulosilytica TaxID=2011013 RepID=UPI0015CCB3E4|nr:alpha/beta hydrolase [Evansella halocellulosilytica]